MITGNRENLAPSNCDIDRTFTSILNFPQKATKTNPIKRIYRNTIYLAREHKDMIDSGHMKNHSDLARKLGISRVRVHQMLNLLKPDSLIIQELKKHGDLLKLKPISERMLR